MNELTYFEAWSLWFQGNMISDRVLWGFQILWWGRLGKIVGLLAAFAIVAELVGPQRLRQTGTALRTQFHFSQAWNIVTSVFNSLWLLVRFFWASGKEDSFLDAFFETRLGKITLIAWLIAMLGILSAYGMRMDYGSPLCGRSSGFLRVNLS